MRVTFLVALAIALGAPTAHAAALHDCPASIADPRIQGVGGDGVQVKGLSCAAGYSLVRAWFRAAPHNTVVRGFHFSARKYVVTGRSRSRLVRFTLYGTD